MMMDVLRILVLACFLPTFVSACNFTKIKPTVDTGNILTVQIFTTGVEAVFPPYPPNETVLPDVLVFNSETTKGAVYRLSVLYADGLNYTVNMYTTGKEFYVSYLMLEVDSPRSAPTTNCTIQSLPIEKAPQSITYSKVADNNKRTSSILKFYFTTKAKDSSNVKYISSVTTIIACFVLSAIL